MAESVISYVVQSLSNQIIQKAEFLGGVRGQVEWLRNELQRMQCFLKDADAKQEGNERVKNWVNEIRNAAYDAEDIVDTFIFKIESWRRRGFIMRYAHIPKELFDREKVGKEIEALRARISDISRSRETYGIKNIGEGTSSTSTERLRELRRSSPRGVDKDIIGMEMDVNQLVAQLLTKENRLTVISLVGMGGIGKTTLAKKVFNHGDVRGHFDCVAWVCVSQEYKLKDVLLIIISEVIQPTEKLKNMLEEELKKMLYELLDPREKLKNMQEEELEKMLYELLDQPTEKLKNMQEEELEKMFYKLLGQPTEKLKNMQEEELEKMLYKLLKKKRYLVVVDDIWSKEAWDLLKRAFPESDNGSKVMLTTRNKDVAWHADPRTTPHELRLLGKEESWELFLRKAFVDGNYPLEFEDIGRRIVEKCEGLPLAIIVVGGLLCRKSLVRDWERALKNINSFFAKEENSVLAILALSYVDLPGYLKPCFLHLGHFPEDFVISRRKLFHQWIAEGLIPRSGEKMEVIAEDYLNELIDRNLVQVVRTNASKRAKECRLHDVIRDLSIFQAKKEIFLEVYGQKDFQPSENCRRLAIHSDFVKYFTSMPPVLPKLRSLHAFFPKKSGDKCQKLDFNCTSFKLLRVLELDNMEILPLSRKIGNLINLRYLSLQDTEINKLPSSMRNLQSLQTLYISGNLLFEDISKVISKMGNLQHLYMNPLDCSGKLKIDTLKNLQTFSLIHIDNWELENSREQLNLQKLGVALSFDSDVNRFCNSMAELEQLESLHVVSASPCRSLPLLLVLSQVHRLNKLRLEGRIRKLPLPHEFPPNIGHLTLHWSLLAVDPMGVLKQLPKLSVLRLKKESYLGQQMTIPAGGFPLLKFLEIEELDNLKDLTIEDGAMPRLRHFRISSCQDLWELPVGIMSVTTLQELEICSMPILFVNRLQEVESYKVEHIPSVTIN